MTTTIEPSRRVKALAYDAYEYTAHSHTYMSDSTPAAKFTYDMSPIQASARAMRGTGGGGALARWWRCHLGRGI